MQRSRCRDFLCGSSRKAIRTCLDRGTGYFDICLLIGIQWILKKKDRTSLPMCLPSSPKSSIIAAFLEIHSVSSYKALLHMHLEFPLLKINVMWHITSVIITSKNAWWMSTLMNYQKNYTKNRTFQHCISSFYSLPKTIPLPFQRASLSYPLFGFQYSHAMFKNSSFLLVMI